MLRAVEDHARIAEAERLFVQRFEQWADQRIIAKLGFLGGHVDSEVSWSSELGIWMSSRDEVGKKYWNAFGTKEPAEGRNLPITCEINPPLAGINRRLARVYLEDDFGQVILAHRGNIGGGRPGIGKRLFEKNYAGGWIVVQDGNLETHLAFVCALGSLDFGPQIRDIVLEVDRIKGLASAA